MTPAEIANKAREMAVEWIRLGKTENSDDMLLDSISKRSSPEADIIIDSRSDSGIKYYFEVKGTTKDGDCFGAATLTECEKAIENQGRYWFLLVNITKDLKEAVMCLTLQEILKYMTVPPFKINFNLGVKKHQHEVKEKTIKHLIRAYKKITRF